MRKHQIFIVFMTSAFTWAFLLSCGTQSQTSKREQANALASSSLDADEGDAANQQMPADQRGTSQPNDKNEDELDEDIVAIRPTVISGAYLSCQATNLEDETPDSIVACDLNGIRGGSEINFGLYKDRLLVQGAEYSSVKASQNEQNQIWEFSFVAVKNTLANITDISLDLGTPERNHLVKTIGLRPIDNVLPAGLDYGKTTLGPLNVTSLTKQAQILADSGSVKIQISSDQASEEIVAFSLQAVSTEGLDQFTRDQISDLSEKTEINIQDLSLSSRNQLENNSSQFIAYLDEQVKMDHNFANDLKKSIAQKMAVLHQRHETSLAAGQLDDSATSKLEADLEQGLKDLDLEYENAVQEHRLGLERGRKTRLLIYEGDQESLVDSFTDRSGRLVSSLIGQITESFGLNP